MSACSRSDRHGAVCPRSCLQTFWKTAKISMWVIYRVRDLNRVHAEYRDCAASRLESACAVLPWGRYTLCLEVTSGLSYKVSKTKRAPSLFLETVPLTLSLKSFAQEGHWKIYNNVYSFSPQRRTAYLRKITNFRSFLFVFLFSPSLSSLFSLFEIFFDVAHFNGI